MTPSLLRRRLCITIMLAGSLLFLSLTAITSNNSNNALAQSQPNSDFESANRADEANLEDYIECLQAQAGPFHEPLDCGPAPGPLQPLDCNELQSCPPPPCDPNVASCPQQPSSPPPSIQPLSPEEACQRFGCINPVPPGTPTPAEQREKIRRFFEDLDSLRRNLLWGPATEGCRLGGVSDPERCGRITNPVWDAIEGLHDVPQPPRLKPPQPLW